jgi:hypothetical protein
MSGTQPSFGMGNTGLNTGGFGNPSANLGGNAFGGMSFG